MRQTRIKKPRHPSRPSVPVDDPFPLTDLRDPRDPDIVRAKRLRAQGRGGTS